MRRTPLALLLLGALGAATLAGCGDSSATGTANPGSGGGTSSAAPASGLTGPVVTAGSSTVGPLTKSIGDRFHAYQPAVDVQVKITSTGEGLKEFCAGTLDIANASRPIEPAEREACAGKGIEPHQILVANDGISVVVPAADAAVSCLTTAELKRLWEPTATGAVSTWKQVRASLPDTKLALYGPDKSSGTLDFFTEKITGAQKSIRSDYSGSEDDMDTVRGVRDHAGGVGFLGHSYVVENPDAIKAVAVDNGKGCVSPSTATVLDGSYAPLSRPLFIYVNTARLKERPQVKAFAEYYVQWARNVAADSDFVPVTDAQREQSKQQLADAEK